MNNEDRIKKLPVWAQEHIEGIERLKTRAENRYGDLVRSRQGQGDGSHGCVHRLADTNADPILMLARYDRIVFPIGDKKHDTLDVMMERTFINKENPRQKVIRISSHGGSILSSPVASNVINVRIQL